MTSTTGRRNNSLRGSGFTLVELVMVLAIITILTSIAVPFLRGFLAGRKSANAAAQVIALAQYARTQAVGTGVVYRLNVDAASKTYWLTQKKQTTFESVGNDFGQHFTFPDGMTAAWQPLNNVPIVSVGSGATVTTGPTNTTNTGSATPGANSPKHDYADFYPDGRADAGRLRLTDASGKVFEMGCLSETERFMAIESQVPR